MSLIGIQFSLEFRGIRPRSHETNVTKEAIRVLGQAVELRQHTHHSRTTDISLHMHL